MIKNKCFLFVFLTIAIVSPVWAQSYNARQIELAERLDSLADNAPPEFAYIQTSKDIYETGEDLWFKVYLLNSRTLSLSELSKTLYLQLVKEDTKKVLWHEMYEIEDGFSYGRILLREDMDEGNYLIEAFTANSLFADSSEFTAIRKVKVVKDIGNLRQIKAEFDKQYYGSSDSIKVRLLPAFQKDTSKINITATLKSGGNVQSVLHTTMKLNEEQELSFKPQSLGKRSQVVINSKYQDHSEEVILPVPGRWNPIQFNVFPESGTIISGIKNRVAFKAVNINGEPVNVNGTLYKNDSVELEFGSMHDGMGSFDFMPVKNAKYHIRLRRSLTDSIFSFPQIEPEGLRLRLLSRDKDYLNFLISKNSEGQFENFYLMVQIRGVIYGLTEAKLDKDLKIKVPLADMPQGIAEVTLFNDKMIPVAERLVYVNPEKKIKIQVIMPDSIFSTRGKVNLKIITRDEKNNPVKANLGMTVFDKIYENQSDSINILTHMYLSTQLKGRIYNPSYYFNSDSKNREESLDLLMLTQGWRKYIWSEANLKKLTQEPQKIIFDGIIGNLYNPGSKKNKIPKEQSFVMAFSPNIDSSNVFIPADPEGVFTVSADKFKVWANDYVYLKPMGPKGSNLKIKLNDPFETINRIMGSNEISYPLISLFKVKKAISETSYSAGSDVVRIKEVTVKGEKGNIIRGKYLGTLDSIANLTLDLNTDYVCSYGILNCPKCIKSGNIRAPVEGEIVMDPRLGERIVYHHVPSKRNFTEEELLSLFNLYRTKAYYANREFYQPNYDKDSADSMIPDFRNTLLWAPSVFTNTKGEATLSFYCSDINTDFVGRIEGVGGEGLLGTGYFKFTVRKMKITP